MTDELDPDLARLRAAHARVGSASQRVVAASRARVMAASLQAVNEPSSASIRSRRSRWLPRPLVIALGSGLAVAALAIISLLPGGASERLPGGGDSGLAAAAERSCSAPATSRQASTACLNALGAVAGDWQVPGRGDVLYQRSWWSTSARHMGSGTANGNRRNSDAGSYMITRGAEKEVWVAPNGSGESLQLGEGPPQLPSAADRVAWIADGRPPLELPGSGRATGSEIGLGQARLQWKAGDAPPDLFPVGEIRRPGGERALLRSGDPVKEFATDPVRLRAQVLDFAWRQRIELSGDDRCAKDLHDCTPGVRRNITSNFASVSVALLQYPPATRALRAAVLEMLAAEPGYRAMGAAADPRGRRGIAVLLPGQGADGQNVLLIDPQTARLTAIGASPNDTLGATRWQQLLNLQVERVERVGDRPS